MTMVTKGQFLQTARRNEQTIEVEKLTGSYRKAEAESTMISMLRDSKRYQATGCVIGSVMMWVPARESNSGLTFYFRGPASSDHSCVGLAPIRHFVNDADAGSGRPHEQVREDRIARDALSAWATPGHHIVPGDGSIEASLDATRSCSDTRNSSIGWRAHSFYFQDVP